jgi:hypothetical protein
MGRILATKLGVSSFTPASIYVKKSSVSSNKSDGNGLCDGVAVDEDEAHSQADKVAPCTTLTSYVKIIFHICCENVIRLHII